MMFARGTPRAAVLSIYGGMAANVCFALWAYQDGYGSFILLNGVYLGLNLWALVRWTRWNNSPGRCNQCGR